MIDQGQNGRHERGHAIKHIVVLASGSSMCEAWLAALMLKVKMQPVALDISVVFDANKNFRESNASGSAALQDLATDEDEQLIIGTPSLQSLHKQMGIDEREFMRTCDAEFRMADFFSPIDEANFYLSFSENPCHFDGVDLTHCISYLSKSNRSEDLLPTDKYTLGACAAKSKRFSHANSKNKEVNAQLSYGYVFDKASYSKLLKERAVRRGVVEVVAELECMEQSADGNIKWIKLKNGERVTADFYIDARALQVSGSKIKPNCIEAAHYKVVRAVNEISGNEDSSAHQFNYSQSRLQRVMKSSRFTESIDYLASEEKAASERERDEETETKHIVYSRRAWQGNCLSVGCAAADLGDIFIDRIHLVQSAMLRFMDLFPVGVEFLCNAEQYNELAEREYAHVADFHIALLRAPSLKDTAHRLITVGNNIHSKESEPLPKSLCRRIALFADRGEIPQLEGESIGADIWKHFFLNCGLMPRAVDPIVHTKKPNDISLHLMTISEQNEKVVAAMFDHRDYRERYIRTKSEQYKNNK